MKFGPKWLYSKMTSRQKKERHSAFWVNLAVRGSEVRGLILTDFEFWQNSHNLRICPFNRSSSVRIRDSIRDSIRKSSLVRLTVVACSQVRAAKFGAKIIILYTPHSTHLVLK